jgi:hypothetical protein
MKWLLDFFSAGHGASSLRLLCLRQWRSLSSGLYWCLCLFFSKESENDEANLFDQSS